MKSTEHSLYASHIQQQGLQSEASQNHCNLDCYLLGHSYHHLTTLCSKKSVILITHLNFHLGLATYF